MGVDGISGEELWRWQVQQAFCLYFTASSWALLKLARSMCYRRVYTSKSCQFSGLNPCPYFTGSMTAVGTIRPAT